MDALAALTMVRPANTDDGPPVEDKKKKKKKRKTLDYSKLQGAGYKPPEDAATDLRQAREEVTHFQAIRRHS